MNPAGHRVVIFLGPPGAGKGTQAERLAAEEGLTKISTGDILRDHINRETELGLQVKEVMAKGQLVSDEILVALIRDKLASLEKVRVIFDGFPRNLAQGKALDVLLEELGVPISRVLVLDVPSEELIHRIVERGKVSGRSDDTEEVARDRQEIYHKDTEPLVEYYGSRGQLRHVNGLGSLDDVHERLLGALE